MRMIFTLAACAGLMSGPILADELFNQGKDVFQQLAQPSCSICHTLNDAGSSGEIGPKLDDLKPTAEQVANAVTGGVGIMPAFEETLSAEQIKAVAHYVSTASRQ
ncbi:sulfide dehydrogenase [Marinobacterium aestuarii]|uniref:Sulfide dehydrogenase n=1 Tax=Marinobacterium aestuarii TaxID=1821621 RepID=A0A1A9F1Q2_9GAMM|nr:cytochrome c [Marinobacterium aestuarii]ANG64264.1 sulfide dehydrogenase [Marinobacterium aestuarii]